MKLAVMLGVILGISCMWAAQACENKEDACPGCNFKYWSGSATTKWTGPRSTIGRNCDREWMKEFNDDTFVNRGHAYDSNVPYYKYEVAVCNMFGCNCNRCDPGCTLCQKNSLSFGGALAPAASTTNATDPCNSFNEFAAMTVPQQMAQLNAAFCADPAGSSVGFKFLGYVLNLVDANKDGVITCSEYNTDQASDLDVIKKKPQCPLAMGLKLKNAHAKV